jgi:hypothetical protein
MVGGPIWQYLYVNHYPFDRPEGILLPLAAALLGAGIALAGRGLGGLPGHLTFAALLFVFTDLQLELQSHISTYLVLTGCIGLAVLLQHRRAVLACITLGAFYLASLPRADEAPADTGAAIGAAASGVSPAAATPAPDRPRPPPLLVHLILDEQWGIGGLRAAGDSATAAFLTDFYLRRGFEVHEAAYSRWPSTLASVPDLMSLGGAFQVKRFGGPRAPLQLRANPYFAWLRDLGYAIHVYQSSYLDYCHSTGVVVASCAVAAGNSIANIGYLQGEWTLRGALAGRYFLNMTSHVYRRLHGRDEDAWTRSVVGRALEQLRQVRDAVSGSPGWGTAIFVHVLVPHQPLEVGTDCSAYWQRAYWHRLPVESGVNRLDTIRAATPMAPDGPSSDFHLSGSAWRMRLAQYGAQVYCVHREIARIMAAIDSTVGPNGAIVIVHGDHGSKLSPDTSRYGKLSEMNRDQLNGLFSTLLAIRRPRVPKALRQEPVPVQDLFWALVRSDFKGEISPLWAHYVRMAPGRSRADPRDSLRQLSREEMLWARSEPLTP